MDETLVPAITNLVKQLYVYSHGVSNVHRHSNSTVQHYTVTATTVVLLWDVRMSFSRRCLRF